MDSGVEEVVAESVVVMAGFGGDGGGNGGRELRVCEDSGLHLRTAKKKEEGRRKKKKKWSVLGICEYADKMFDEKAERKEKSNKTLERERESRN